MTTDMTTETGTFKPAAHHVALAASLGVDLEKEFAAFEAYNRTRTVRDPERALSGWIRRAASNRDAKPAQAEKPAEQSVPTDPEEYAKFRIQEFRNSNPREYDRLLEYLQGHSWWPTLSERFQNEELRQAIKDRHVIFNNIGFR
jgi:hypothetical protein